MMQFKLDIAAVILLIINITITDSQNNQNKVVNNESSCSLNGVTGLNRTCMCDEDCKIYKDCCKDSDYYNETEQLQKSIYQCHPKYRVYMIASCPLGYVSSSVTQFGEKCDNSSFHMNPAKRNISKQHKSHFNPVSAISKNITFANLHCAECHNEKKYTKWNYTVKCWALNDVIPANVSAHSDGSYYPEQMKCLYNVTRPENKTAPIHVRFCAPAVSTCKIDKKLQHACDSYTAYVQDNDGTIYKNADCAKCNNATKTKAYRIYYDSISPTNIGFSMIFQPVLPTAGPSRFSTTIPSSMVGEDT